MRSARQQQEGKPHSCPTKHHARPGHRERCSGCSRCRAAPPGRKAASAGPKSLGPASVADSRQLARCQAHVGRQPAYGASELPGVRLFKVLKLNLQQSQAICLLALASSRAHVQPALCKGLPQRHAGCTLLGCTGRQLQPGPALALPPSSWCGCVHCTLSAAARPPSTAAGQHGAAATCSAQVSLVTTRAAQHRTWHSGRWARQPSRSMLGMPCQLSLSSVRCWRCLSSCTHTLCTLSNAGNAMPAQLRSVRHRRRPSSARTLGPLNDAGG